MDLSFEQSNPLPDRTFGAQTGQVGPLRHFEEDDLDLLLHEQQVVNLLLQGVEVIYPALGQARLDWFPESETMPPRGARDLLFGRHGL